MVMGMKGQIFSFDVLFAFVALCGIAILFITNMWLVGKFFGDEDIFNIDTKKGLKIINVHGQS